MTGYEIVGLTIYALLCAWVAAAANKRGKYGWAWFIVAMIITPILAAILLAITPRKTVFEAEAAYRGVPYYSRRSGEVVALIDGAKVRFANIGDFRSAMDQRGSHG